MKIKNYEVLSTVNALSKIDPQEDPVTKETKESKYKFKGSVLYALAKNHRKLSQAVTDIERVRVKLFKQYQVGNEERLEGASAEKFVTEYNTFLESEAEIELYTIKAADLDLDNNQIPLKLLSELDGKVTVE